MPVKTRNLDRMLQGKLHAEVRERGPHTKYFVWYQGRTVSRTQLSRGHKEIDDTILSQICHQLHINRKQLRLLLDCPWKCEDYIDHVTRTS